MYATTSEERAATQEQRAHSMYAHVPGELDKAHHRTDDGVMQAEAAHKHKMC